MTLPSGASLVPSPDGGVAIVGEDGTVIAQVARPWAFDATGSPVETSYRVADNALIQTVSHADSVYPMVADPRLTVGWGVYVYMTGQEIKAVGTALLAAGGAAVIATCTLDVLDNLPVAGTALKVIKVLCTWLGFASVKPILSAISKLVNSKTLSTSVCYEYKVPGKGSFKAVGRDNCSWP
jgi:hypothetical protein